jgi:hypothetical protein
MKWMKAEGVVDLVDLVDLDGRLETEKMAMRQRMVSAFPSLSCC